MRVALADAVVPDLDHRDVIAAVRGYPGTGGAAVFGDVGEGLADDEPDGGLDGFRWTSWQVDIDVDGDRASVGEFGYGRGETPVGEYLRMDAADQVAQLVECGLRVVVCLVDELVGRGRVGGALQPDHAQRHDQAGESLLGTVVQVAFDATALGVHGVHDAGAGACQFDHLHVGALGSASGEHRAGEQGPARGVRGDQVQGVTGNTARPSAGGDVG